MRLRGCFLVFVVLRTHQQGTDIDQTLGLCDGLDISNFIILDSSALVAINGSRLAKTRTKMHTSAQMHTCYRIGCRLQILGCRSEGLGCRLWVLVLGYVNRKQDRRELLRWPWNSTQKGNISLRLLPVTCLPRLADYQSLQTEGLVHFKQNRFMWT